MVSKTTTRLLLAAPLAAGLLLAAGAPKAEAEWHGGGWHGGGWHGGWHGGGWHGGWHGGGWGPGAVVAGTVLGLGVGAALAGAYAPPPVVYAPPPVVYAPPPTVYYAPPPVVVYPRY
jgi:hypothetical protein